MNKDFETSKIGGAKAYFWTLFKSTHINKWSRRRNRPTHMLSWFFYKGAKAIQWRKDNSWKDSSFDNQGWSSWTSIGKQ